MPSQWPPDGHCPVFDCILWLGHIDDCLTLEEAME
jgi:hypothetical protein